MSLEKELLIFTSAGDSSNVKQWLDGVRNYDVIVAYYGDSNFEHSKNVEHFFLRKGGKFQNLYACYNSNKEIFEKYKYVAIFDDDVIIAPVDINKFFKIMSDSKLHLAQPSFDRRGKLSHPLTLFNPTTSLRYTNFVEVNVPVFSAGALALFMKVYDPRINCWGVDWWYSSVIEREFGVNSIAIIDDVTCINPHDIEKNPAGIREIDKISSDSDRRALWQQIKNEKNIITSEPNQQIYKEVHDFNFSRYLKWVGIELDIFIARVKRKLGKLASKRF